MGTLTIERVDMFGASIGAGELLPVGPEAHAGALHLPRYVPAEAGRAIDLDAAGRRVFDICFSVTALLCSAPLLATVAMLVKMTSKGPVFLRQKRLTLHGREFVLMKFRTMRADAEAVSGPVLAEEDDPRVTGLGRFLRKTRIDELPQFWNVLWGDMSVVGPRPERPEIAANLARSMRRFGRRLNVKAGITGLAQVEHGYCATAESYRRKLALDLLYIKKRSMRMDLGIMLRTVSVVFLGTGAR